MSDLTKDEEMMLLFYGADTKEEFLENIRAMQACLMPEERRLRRLSDSVIRKVEAMNEDEFARRMRNAGL